MNQEPDVAPVLPSTCVLYQGDCLDVMPTLAPSSVAMVFADIPYSFKGRKCTLNTWDFPIDLKTFWDSISASTKAKASVIFTATQPFATILINSNFKDFRHDLIWDKLRASGFANAKISPMRSHEHVLIFCKKKTTYNPQMTKGHAVMRVRTGTGTSSNWGIKPNTRGSTDRRYPLSVLSIKRDDMRNRNGHPTQKPVALLEWLTATYTNPGDTVLDPTFGSCTTGVACARLGRNFIGIEKDADYFRVGRERVNAERLSLGLPPATAHVSRLSAS